MTVVILVGIPGCGKSTFAAANTGPPHLVLSSDAIREELTGDPMNQDRNGYIFKTLHRRLECAANDGQAVMVDATNLKPRSRKEIAHIADLYAAERIAIRFTTPIDVCLARNKNRDRIVPDYAMDRMVKQFEQHCTREILEAEGWKVEEVMM